MSSREVVVDVRGLTKRFGEHVIFEEVSLQVERSEVVAIVGPSGAGKSTFIRCLNYLHPFEAGTVTILGHELHGTAEGTRPPSRAVLREIRTHVGMVFQSFNLFHHLTVMDNIVLAPVEVKRVPRREAVERARDLLAMMGLADKADVYPRRLSGGQQQRVAICRALAMEPQIMLFDEPTSMLDPELVGEVLEAIQTLAEQGMTMLLVTHEMMFARDVADTVVVMADGGVVEAGAARDVLERPQAERTRAFLRRVLRHAAPQGGDAVGSGVGGPQS